MKKYKLFTFILVFLVFHLVIINPIKIQATSNFTYENVEKFVKDIYSSYTDTKYIFIYQNIHPEIKSTFKKNKYIKVHKEYFKKNDIKIMGCKIKTINNIDELPTKFSDYIALKESDDLLSVSIEYKAKIRNSKKDISKKVYVLKNNKGDLFLLWDPKILNDL